MGGQRVNITAKADWFAGEDQAFQFTIYDAAGEVQDITGWTITFKTSLTKGGAAVLTKTAALTTPLAGVCTVSVAAADTSAVVEDTPYYFTLARTDSGFNQVLAHGGALLQARPGA